MKKRILIWSGVLVAALLIISTILTGCTRTTQNAAPAPAAPVSQVVSTSVAPASTIAPAGTVAPPSSGPGPGGPQEGVTVHGHWVIDVSNPDGTRVSHTEFDNALTSNGALTLVNILGRKNSVGGWCIYLGALNGTSSPFMDASSVAHDGVLAEGTYPGSDPYVFKNLAVSGFMNAVLFTGEATAQRNGTIDVYATGVARLAPTTGPVSSYPGVGIFNFTNANLGSAVSVTTGQRISVTVTLTFS
jgi:hypothetical protein